MKGLRGQFLRQVILPVVGVGLAGVVAGGCSDNKSSNPDAVTVDELKYPGNLTITDHGNGKATLWWTGANNEGDFDGYNVYGMADTTGALVKLAGTSIQLLDDNGDPIDSAKATLQNFDYDPSTKMEKPSTPTPANDTTAAGSGDGANSGSSDTPDFSFRPIHAMSTATPTDMLLPTCKATTASGVATCSLTTDANVGQAVSDQAGFAVNGKVQFTPPDTMTIGTTYCFTVLASEKEGAKVSATSSKVACITPKYATQTSGTVGTFKIAAMPNDTTSGKDFLVWDLSGWVKADCTATGSTPGCTDPTATDNSGPFIKVDTATHGASGAHNASDAGPIYIEAAAGESTTVVSWVTGKGAGITDLGYYAGGFTDPTRPMTIAALTIDSNTLNGSGTSGTSFSSGAPILNNGGYSVAGQSVPIVQNHLYVFAGPATGSGKFHYYWVYVKTFTAGGAEGDFEVYTAVADDTLN